MVMLIVCMLPLW